MNELYIAAMLFTTVLVLITLHFLEDKKEPKLFFSYMIYMFSAFVLLVTVIWIFTTN